MTQVTPIVIYDRLAALVDDTTTKRSRVAGMETLPVAGFRLRIRGRPRGEEMAAKYDFLKGSCPKRDQNALMDFGKHTILTRSGSVGIKCWIHFQKPHRQDLTGRAQLLHALQTGVAAVTQDEEEETAVVESTEGWSNPMNSLLSTMAKSDPTISMVNQQKTDAATTATTNTPKADYSSLLTLDRDYDPNEQLPEPSQEFGRGLWNVQSSNDPLVRDLVRQLKNLHQPDHEAASRFLW